MDARTAMEQPVTRRRVWVVDGDAHQLAEVEMALEEPLALAINGAQAAILMRLPGMEKELAVGFCLSEGLVQSLDDILMVHHCGRGLPVPGEPVPGEPVPGEDEGDESSSRNRVELRVRPEGLSANARLDVVRLIRAGCGAVDVDRAELPLEPVGPGPRVTIETLRALGPAMRDAQRVHRDVGGVHAAALFDAQGGLIIL
ncbi:MAG: formate dehydrogenase accessory sulfurtransferase FdhD, partial [Chloroflexota bacterium]